MERIEALIKMVERQPIPEDQGLPYSHEEVSQLWKPIAQRLIPGWEYDSSANAAADFICHTNKGAVLIGNVGSGKTTTMRIFQQVSHMLKRDGNIPEWGRMVIPGILSTRQIQMRFGAEGDSFLLELSEQNFLCIDDLGSETPIVNQYGTKSDPIASLLFLRYEKWQQSKVRTYATSNLTKEQLKTRYGERLFDRMKEMFIFIVMKGESKRK